jgi:hypothetical protein
MKRVSDVTVTKQVSPPFLWDPGGVTGQVKPLMGEKRIYELLNSLETAKP